MNWQDAGRDEELRRQWDAGLSAGQIAAESFQGRVSRNAIIGRIHRMKLPKRLNNLPGWPYSRTPRPPRDKRGESREALDRRAAQKRADRAAAAALRPPRAYTPRCIEEISVPVSLELTTLQLTEHTCKWPTGEATGEHQHYCGKAIGVGQQWPWCEYHIALGTVPRSSPNERAARRASQKSS